MQSVRRGLIGVLSALFVLSAPPLMAQESIFDPENPALQDDDPAPGDDPGEEIICDPENPACPTHTSRDGVIFDPENPGVVGDAETGAVGSFTSATFLGEYTTSLLVDLGFDGQGEDIVELVTGFRLSLEYDLSRHTRAVVAGHFLHWVGGQENVEQIDYLLNAEEARAHFEAWLGETYILHRPGRWSFAIGNLITRWGSTDLIRPADVINPTDTRFAAAGAMAGTLLPQLTASAAYAGDGWSVTVLVVPFFVANRISLFGRDTALAQPGNPLVNEQIPVLALVEQALDPSLLDAAQPMMAATRIPRETPANASAGFRATTTVANTDLGLGAFFGWDRTPWMFMDNEMREMLRLIAQDGQVLEDFDFMGFVQRNPQALRLSASLSKKREAGEELFYSEYRRRTTLAVDLARYIGPIGVRADVAFSPRRTFYTSGLQPAARSGLFSALGLSYERLDDEHPLLLTLEGFWLHPFGADSGPTELFVAADERGAPDDDLLLIGDGLYGLAGALVWELPGLDATELQLGGAATLSNGDLIASAMVRRRWESWLRTSLGANLFFGPDPTEQLSLGGLFDRNDQLIFSVDGAF